MRYIPKGSEPVFMVDWKNVQLQNGVNLLYNNFPDKKELNEVLRKEQRGICCYCQRRIDHFQYPREKGCHNEHLYPENRLGDQMSVDKQLDYNNIFACCIDSRGHRDYEKYLRYCGEAKGNEIIPELIIDNNCSEYFRYNIRGEIVPNGDFYSWSDYVSNKYSLTGNVLNAYKCIEILNLNCITLVNYRWELLNAMVSVVKKWSVETINSYIQGMLNSNPYPELVDMKLHFFKKRISLLTKD